MNKLSVTTAIFSVLVLSGCGDMKTPLLTLSQAESTKIENQVDQLLNTGTAQLQLTIKVANSFTPPDADGAQCAQAAITIVNELNATNAVLQGQPLGGIPAAEVASVMIPGSDQFDNVVNTLGSGCFAKAHDVQKAITIASSPATILAAALPAMPGIAAAVQPLAAGL